MFGHYFKISLRNLERNKIYSFINVAGLSIGLSCVMLISLYVNDEISYDRFHKNVNQIYRIDKQNTKGDGSVNNGSYTGYFPGPRFAARYLKYKPSYASNHSSQILKQKMVFSPRL